MIIDLIGLLEIVALGAETVGAITTLLDAIATEPQPDYSGLTDAQKLDLLKRCTMIVVRLNVEVNCMPMGATTAICFDSDGNPIP